MYTLPTLVSYSVCPPKNDWLQWIGRLTQVFSLFCAGHWGVFRWVPIRSSPVTEIIYIIMKMKLLNIIHYIIIDHKYHYRLTKQTFTEYVVYHKICWFQSLRLHHFCWNWFLCFPRTSPPAGTNHDEKPPKPCRQTSPKCRMWSLPSFTAAMFPFLLVQSP